MFSYTPLEIAQAHQFLYYCYPDYIVWSDYDYDRFCRYHGIDGTGGSDNPEDYSKIVRGLAWNLHRDRSLHRDIFDKIPTNIVDIKVDKSKESRYQLVP